MESFSTVPLISHCAPVPCSCAILSLPGGVVAQCCRMLNPQHPKHHQHCAEFLHSLPERFCERGVSCGINESTHHRVFSHRIFYCPYGSGLLWGGVFVGARLGALK